MNMLVDPLITGDVEADETWIKTGPKYPGRGQPVSCRPRKPVGRGRQTLRGLGDRG